MRVAAVIAALLLVGALLPSPVHAGEEGADVYKEFNEFYPVAFRARVGAALDRGRDWLLSAQREEGSWNFFTHHREYPMGATALATLTLLKCGVPREHPKIVRAFAYLRALPLVRVYSVSVLLMALDAKYAPARDPFALEDVDAYGLRPGSDPCASEITPEDLAWMREGVAWLCEHQRADGTWRYPHGGYDLSNTQFALLGLDAAVRCGVPVKQAVWLDALRRISELQEVEGPAVMYQANEVRGRYRFEWTERALARGFRYTPDSEQPTAAMTTAGLTCLVICQNRLWRTRAFTGDLRTGTRRGIRDAMAWLQEEFSPSSNRGGSSRWTFYFLYGLERAGILGRFRFLGTHDWYREGAEFLLGRQVAQGYFESGAHWEASCFALLFLKRATTRMHAPVLTPRGAEDGRMPEEEAKSGRRAPQDPTPKSETERAVLAAQAIRALEERDADAAFLAAKHLGVLGLLRAVDPLVRALRLHADPDVRTAAAQSLGQLQAADAVDPLVLALLDADPLVRYAAETALRRITTYRPGETLRAAAGHSDRVRVQKAWRAWWSEHEAETRVRLSQPKPQ
ncbi:MAG: HEAT repeat domain-containing protein [Planctomycetota bacterium]|nr:HEAT repeat domain-containing protein [Planctomycetota bacterium]